MIYNIYISADYKRAIGVGRMDLKQIQYVLELNKQRNFSKAAEELFISQPALSAQILAIERELGVKLFDRTTHSVSLTRYGELFCEKSHAVMAAWDELLNSIETYRLKNRVKIRIGLSFRAHSSRFLPICISFFEKNQDYELSFATKSIDELLDDIYLGELDAVLCRIPVGENNPHYRQTFSSIELDRELSCVVMSKNCHLASKKSLTINELQGETMIVGLENSHEDRILKSITKNANVIPFDVIRVNSVDMAIYMARENKGIMLGAKSIADYYDLAAVPKEPISYGVFGMVYSSLNTNPALRDLIVYMKKYS